MAGGVIFGSWICIVSETLDHYVWKGGCMLYADSEPPSRRAHRAFFVLMALGTLGALGVLASRGLGEAFQSRARFFAGGSVALHVPRSGSPPVPLSFDADGAAMPDLGPIRASLSRHPDDAVALVYIQGQGPVPGAGGVSVAERFGAAWRFHYQFDVRVLEIEHSESPVADMTSWTAGLHTREVGPHTDGFADMQAAAVSVLSRQTAAWPADIAGLAASGAVAVSPDRANSVRISGHRSSIVVAIVFYAGAIASVIAVVGAVWLVAWRALNTPAPEWPVATEHGRS